MNLMQFILGLEKEETRKSNFMLALKSARLHTGRDIDTGIANSIYEMEWELSSRPEVIENKLADSELFIGLTIYLILLEQIGSIFERTDIAKKTCHMKGIKYALCIFSDLTDKKEIEAINGLRNNLAHNFGLASDSRFPNNAHKFTLSFSNDAPIVKLPTKEWNCKYEDKSDDSSTVIGVYAFCNKVEQVVKNLIDIYRAGNLKFKLSEEEIKSRFTILIYY